MKQGELVEIVHFNRWGGASRTGRRGVILSMAYCGYDNESTRWNVFIEGEILVFAEMMLGKVPEVWRKIG